MKVTAVKTFIVPPEVSVTPWCRGNTWVLIKLETDGGVDGWGQAYAFRDRENSIALAVRKLSRHIDGMDPFRIISSLIAVTAMGIVCTFSSRFWAVTITSSSTAWDAFGASVPAMNRQLVLSSVFTFFIFCLCKIVSDGRLPEIIALS